ncbi:hypothetical protein AVEN_21917-1 [Araneus ventricosus]|uniref:Uncharacterized protein n=1 Tax=Araneus ventricosus TaxID=182803 RepID=A0A4Y2D1F3_ARAVE|nr:hypothetical protein AVEN_21917-1 [Araneus ventricosus]
MVRISLIAIHGAAHRESISFEGAIGLEQYSLNCKSNPLHAKAGRQCRKLVRIGAEGWISNPSRKPSLHLDCRAIQVEGVSTCGVVLGCLAHGGNRRRRGSEWLVED